MLKNETQKSLVVCSRAGMGYLGSAPVPDKAKLSKVQGLLRTWPEWGLLVRMVAKCDKGAIPPSQEDVLKGLCASEAEACEALAGVAQALTEKRSMLVSAVTSGQVSVVSSEGKTKGQILIKPLPTRMLLAWLWMEWVEGVSRGKNISQYALTNRGLETVGPVQSKKLETFPLNRPTTGKRSTRISNVRNNLPSIKQRCSKLEKTRDGKRELPFALFKVACWLQERFELSKLNDKKALADLTILKQRLGPSMFEALGFFVSDKYGSFAEYESENDLPSRSLKAIIRIGLEQTEVTGLPSGNFLG